MTNKLLSIKEVLARVTLSKSELYRRMAKGTFPSRVRLGPKRVAFVEHEIDAWIAAQIEGGRAEISTKKAIATGLPSSLTSHRRVVDGNSPSPVRISNNCIASAEEGEVKVPTGARKRRISQ